MNSGESYRSRPRTPPRLPPPPAAQGVAEPVASRGHVAVGEAPGLVDHREPSAPAFGEVAVDEPGGGVVLARDLHRGDVSPGRGAVKLARGATGAVSWPRGRSWASWHCSRCSPPATRRRRPTRARFSSPRAGPKPRLKPPAVPVSLSFPAVPRAGAASLSGASGFGSRATQLTKAKSTFSQNRRAFVRRAPACSRPSKTQARPSRGTNGSPASTCATSWRTVNLSERPASPNTVAP